MIGDVASCVEQIERSVREVPIKTKIINSSALTNDNKRSSESGAGGARTHDDRIMSPGL